MHALARGFLAGYPLVDMRVALYDGSYHEVDSSDLAFQIAGSMGVQNAIEKARPVILEPVMTVAAASKKISAILLVISIVGAGGC